MADPKTVIVSLQDLKEWRQAWLTENDPGDGTDCITPFDKYLYTASTLSAGALNAGETRCTEEELEAMARQCLHATSDWVLEVANMTPAEMQRRLIHTNDVRAIVLALVKKVEQLKENRPHG